MFFDGATLASLVTKAEAMIDVGKPSEAADLLTYLVALVPDSGSLMLLLGRAHHAQDLRVALHWYERAKGAGRDQGQRAIVEAACLGRAQCFASLDRPLSEAFELVCARATQQPEEMTR